MAKVLAVFGATGQQGSSIVNYVLNDAEFSRQYKIRAITRHLDSEKAQKLKERVEVVQGDVLDRASLEAALTGVQVVFAMTTPSLTPDGVAVEFNSAKTIADVAVQKGAEYIIFSTMPPVQGRSSGKYTEVISFDAKVKAEQYIRSLPIKSAFYAPGLFMENFQDIPYLAPQPLPDGTWALTRLASSKSRIPLIDAIGDTGKFIGAILAEPDKYEGKTFCAAGGIYTGDEIVAILSRATGKTIVYKQVSTEEFKKSLPFTADSFVEFVEALSYGEEFGYYGPDTEKLVAWAAENARGKLSTLEEFLEAHPLQLR
ncbi:HSCARG dehydrogenase [Pleurostoma richardsiae]|uniref:HSCARG dehydrogenase n=1 Tax=Pleurostoma richardsiae TaxID=41990 RepID=A0AA38RTV8_9PEZI|nr:HSCARG dehydrogenase [Pleurostoma richardsiae]